MKPFSPVGPLFTDLYKLVHLGNREIRKLSSGKVTLAGRKQVFRKTDKGGRCLEDVIGLREEAVPGAAPLLEPVMADGRLLTPPPALVSLRSRCRESLAAFAEAHVGLEGDTAYPVRVSDRLAALQDGLKAG